MIATKNEGQYILSMLSINFKKAFNDKAAFEKAAPKYNQALKRSGFKHTFMYKPLHSYLHRSNNNNKKKRKRNIIWFNPPFSENVATNIGKEFFSLLSKHFPPNNRYHKIFNKQNVKLSYSCMPNMGSIIAQHNKQVLDRLSSADTETPPCNCRNKRDCPLEGKCRTKCVIYKASVCTPNVKRCHIMAVVRRILKLVTTTISKALKLHPRETRQSSLDLFGDSKMRVTFRS